MGTNVNLSSIRQTKRCVTHLTFERSIAGVGVHGIHVRVQMRTLAKRRTTSEQNKCLSFRVSNILFKFLNFLSRSLSEVEIREENVSFKPTLLITLIQCFSSILSVNL